MGVDAQVLSSIRNMTNNSVIQLTRRQRNQGQGRDFQLLIFLVHKFRTAYSYEVGSAEMMSEKISRARNFDNGSFLNDALLTTNFILRSLLYVVMTMCKV